MRKIKLKIFYSTAASLLLLSTLGLSQSKPSEKWGRLNLLGADTVWKYKSGVADTKYFDTDFNDSTWETVTYDRQTGLNHHNLKGIGVFRKTFAIPDSLQEKQLELFIGMFGASEIYLDGKMVIRYGSISPPYRNEVRIQQSIPVKPDEAVRHVLAVYYSNKEIRQQDVLQYGLYGYGIHLTPFIAEEEHNNQTFHHLIISLGIILSFCVFFWCVYMFYPYRFASLIAALFLTNFCLIFGGGMLRDFTDPGISRYITGEKIWETGFSCCYGWYLLFLYSLYYKRMNWNAWAVITLMSTSIILIFSQSSMWFPITNIFILLYLAEAFRLLFLGIKNKRTGFWILAIGLCLSLIGVVFTIFDFFNVFPWYLTTTQTVLSVATDLSFPLTLALQFAWEFGSSNRDLRIQLKHVNELSEKTAQQEQEKQQILASQNEKLEQQVSERTSELNSSLNKLKAAQAQLIQSEKMASLGELTAGIAHEIQNPLNFVNNFSEVNSDLLSEMQDEIDKGNFVDVKTIAADVVSNNEKINHHGKRADSIVKGMLQHSRSSAGLKEPTDINALADEYLRLAFHGIRAKDKDFNAALNTSFDEKIGKIDIVPQDIGRVLLNLYNNAFYAVYEKQKLHVPGFEPIVIVKTEKSDSLIIITVKDNGTGIDQAHIDKIFQPFFTTKPTGHGTGLGLSLVYDIVKTHGGSIKVDSKPGIGTTFIIELPKE